MASAFWFGATPATAYRVVLVTQALLSAVLLVLLYGLLRELRIRRGVALGSAVVAATIVDTVFWSTYALSEATLASLVCRRPRETDQRRS